MYEDNLTEIDVNEAESILSEQDDEIKKEIKEEIENEGLKFNQQNDTNKIDDNHCEKMIDDSEIKNNNHNNFGSKYDINVIKRK